MGGPCHFWRGSSFSGSVVESGHYMYDIIGPAAWVMRLLRTPHLSSVATSCFSWVNPSYFNRLLSISQMRNRRDEKPETLLFLQTTILCTQRPVSAIFTSRREMFVRAGTPCWAHNTKAPCDSNLSWHVVHMQLDTHEPKTVISVPQHLQWPEGDQPGYRGLKASS